MPIKRRITATLEQPPRSAVVTSLFGLIVLVACLDYWTGDDVPLLVFYLPVVVLACWWMNLAVAVCLSLICCTLWLLDNLFAPQPPLQFTHYWTTATNLTFFLVVASVISRLRFAHDNTRRLLNMDHLTKLANSQAFVEQAQAEMANSAASGQPLTVAFLDCDNFKQVNDTLGHLTGDELLCAVADTMRRSVRASDVVARMGGDEFVVLLPGVSPEQARVMIGRLQHDLQLAMRQNNWAVTFSIGVVTFTEPPESVDRLIHDADQVMYSIKHANKNAAQFQLVG